VQVILDRILAQERKLQFSIVEEGLPLTGRKPAGKLPKRRRAGAKTRLLRPPKQEEVRQERQAPLKTVCPTARPKDANGAVPRCNSLPDALGVSLLLGKIANKRQLEALAVQGLEQHIHQITRKTRRQTA